MNQLRTRSKTVNEHGFAMAITAISALCLMLMIAFAVDLGSWYLNASKLQRASDAAALAGAIALPDADQAALDARSSLQRNGYVDGTNSISVTTTATPDRFVAQVTDHSIKTYFASLFMSNITINRRSTAIRSNAAPALGSPFNVMGTGDLSIPGLPAKQNYWLAINAMCDPKEDGDFFAATTDNSKGPMTSTLVNDEFVPGAGARHHCADVLVPDLANQTVNANYNKAGYSYFVDIPKPTTAGTSVDIRAYDPGYDARPAQNPIDKNLTLNGDPEPYPDYMFQVWNTNGTVDNEADDTLLVTRGMQPDDTQRVTFKLWYNLYTVPYAAISAAGGQYRIQVTQWDGPPGVDTQRRVQIGSNSFALGAFVNGQITACDSRQDLQCPRVYGRTAVSVYNSLLGASGSTASFYFAELDTSYIGRAFDVQLWDPGEGVSKLELLGPDDTPLTFDWSSPNSTYAGTGVTSLDTSGTGPPPGPNLSNDYKFNDRLVTLHVVLPASYASMVTNAGGDKWLRLRYTIGSTHGDRTTWGISLNAAPSAPPRLSRSF